MCVCVCVWRERDGCVDVSGRYHNFDFYIFVGLVLTVI